jgi:CheY-like chemotaxis protein
MRVLWVDDNADVRRLARLTLEKNLGATVEEAADPLEAIRLIQAQPAYDVIVSDYDMGQSTGADLLKEVRKLTHPPLFVMCSSSPLSELKDVESGNLDGFVPKHELSQKLIPTLRTLLPSQVPPPDQRQDDYVSLPISLVSRIDRMPTHIYLHLSHRYVHVFREGDTLQPQDIEKYAQKGLKTLFVKHEDLDRFVDAFLKNYAAASAAQKPVHAADVLKASVAATDTEAKAALHDLAVMMEKAKQVSLGVGNLISFTEEAYSTVQGALQILKISPDVESAIKATVQLSLEAIRNSPNLKELFQEILANPNRSSGLHATVVGHVACRIAYCMGWKSPATRYKLCLAAFLHDITLRSEKVAALAGHEDFLMAAGSLSDEEKAQYENHPIEAAALALGMSLPPPDVDLILSQHHELPGGGGFPEGINYQGFHPLAAIFVIAEDWVLYTQKERQNASSAEFAKSRARKYDYPLFREMLLKLREEA